MDIKEAHFAFQGGEIVRLLQDHPHIHLKAGDQGYVWGVYDTNPPWYDADFYRQDGSDVAMMFLAEDVELVESTESVRIPQDALEFWQYRAG